jgi:hypothetical protein
LFREIDKTWLRNFVLRIVQPLMASKVVKHKDIGAEMDNVYPAGDLDKFKVAFPFGFASKIPKGVTGFYLSLFGTSQELITIGNMHFTRPKPTGDGDAIFYSTDSTGNTIKATILLKNDGSITVDSKSTVLVKGTGNVTVESGGTVEVKSSNVLVGTGTREKVLNGETIKALWNTGPFLDSFGIPVTPTVTLQDGVHLSNTVKAAK